MKWLSKYNINVSSIDNQHKKLLNLINRLQESVLSSHIDQQMGEAFKFLVTYTQHHFKEEEAFMSAIGYPKIDEQKQLHKLFINELKQMLVKIKNKEQINADELIKFLIEWLKDHIMTEDIQIGQYVAKLQAKGSEIEREYSLSGKKRLITRLNHFRKNRDKNLIDEKEYLKKKSFVISDYFDSQQIETKKALNEQFILINELLDQNLISSSEHKTFQNDLVKTINFEKVLDSIEKTIDKLEYVTWLAQREVISQDELTSYKQQFLDNM